MKEQTEQLFKLAEKMGTKELMYGALYEKDATKKAVYKSMLDYVTKQRQLKIINRKEFVR